ncbi:hypothetical protein [Bacillus pumilus]|uniref:hypothetical protein n=1 Tax=Bacillus pumilus TaxID=1408 RepID=UPI003000E0B1
MKQLVDKIAKQLEKDKKFSSADFRAHLSERWANDPLFKNFIIGFIKRDQNSTNNVPGATGYGKPIIICRSNNEEGLYDLQIDLGDGYPSIINFTSEELEDISIPKPLNEFESFIYSDQFQTEDKKVLDKVLLFVKERVPQHSIPEKYKHSEIIEQLNDLNMLLTTVRSNVMDDFAHISEDVLRLIPELKAWVVNEESKNF